MLYIPLCTTPVSNDLNDDCKMDLLDVEIFASEWLMEGQEYVSNLDDDPRVNWLDFGILAAEWMICNVEPTKARND